MRGLELPRRSTTNRQTDSGRTLHMKTVGFGKGMCEETEERGSTKKNLPANFCYCCCFLQQPHHSPILHISNSNLPVFSDSGCYCTSSLIKPKCPPPQASLSLTNSTQKTTIALEDCMSHLDNYKSSKKNKDDKTVWKGLHFKFSLTATITF
jgi:hypothetical protein